MFLRSSSNMEEWRSNINPSQGARHLVLFFRMEILRILVPPERRLASPDARSRFILSVIVFPSLRDIFGQ